MPKHKTIFISATTLFVLGASAWLVYWFSQPAAAQLKVESAQQASRTPSSTTPAGH